MKKILILATLAAALFSCKKENNTQVTLVGKWHLVADTTLTFSGGSLTKTEYNNFTKQALSDFELELGGNLDLYNNEVYDGQPNYSNSGNGITFNVPVSNAGTPATTKVASIKLQTAGRLLLYFPPASTNGTSVTLDYIKLATKD